MLATVLHGPGDVRCEAVDDPKIRRALSTPGLLAALEAELGAYPEALDAESDEARGRFAVRLLETKRPAFLTLHLLAVDHAQDETGPMSTETFAIHGSVSHGTDAPPRSTWLMNPKLSFIMPAQINAERNDGIAYGRIIATR